MLVAGCTAAAHLSALQPGSLPSSRSVHVPPSLASEYRTPSSSWAIDIDVYTYPGQNIATASADGIKYVRSLHANAISITFPFFMNGPRAPALPPGRPRQRRDMIVALARIAEAHGLYVAFRPLLDETSIDH